LDRKTGDVLVVVDRKYFRPAEIHQLLADPKKSLKKLNWSPKVKFEQLICMMVDSDMNCIERLLKK